MKLPEEAQGFGIVRYLSVSTINLPAGKMSSLLGKTGGFWEWEGWGWRGLEHRQDNNGGTRKHIINYGFPVDKTLK